MRIAFSTGRPAHAVLPANLLARRGEHVTIFTAAYRARFPQLASDVGLRWVPPGDTTMATLDDVLAFASGGSARIQRCMTMLLPPGLAPPVTVSTSSGPGRRVPSLLGGLHAAAAHGLSSTGPAPTSTPSKR